VRFYNLGQDVPNRFRKPLILKIRILHFGTSWPKSRVGQLGSVVMREVSDTTAGLLRARRQPVGFQLFYLIRDSNKGHAAQAKAKRNCIP
jgi:hypothetical protein